MIIGQVQNLIALRLKQIRYTDVILPLITFNETAGNKKNATSFDLHFIKCFILQVKGSCCYFRFNILLYIS